MYNSLLPKIIIYKDVLFNKLGLGMGIGYSKLAYNEFHKLGMTIPLIDSANLKCTVEPMSTL